MSATLGMFLNQLQPDWKIVAFEREGKLAQESSNPWNNAGTGHAALCELNYMPEDADGNVDPAKAVGINEQFQQSREFWSSLVKQGILHDPETFINATPHMTFVKGEKDVSYLKKRYESLKKQPLFDGIEYSEDSRVINQWAPLLMKKRVDTGEVFAATRVPSGTDVDFGALTNQMFTHLRQSGTEVYTGHEVVNLKKQKDGTWNVTVMNVNGRSKTTINAKFVFVGAGGWALPLLQKSGIKEARGYGVFPIGGQFLKTSNPDIVSQHRAKVYSQASVGAPPMSVPHLDARVVDGERSLLFGPFATFSPKFLKNGKITDLVTQVRGHNLFTMLGVAVKNPDLMTYLLGELSKSKAQKVDSLRDFMPSAKDDDWTIINAGQRAQVMKKDADGKAILQFGTEVVAASDGTIAGLLGASPGASTAVSIMLNVLQKCFADDYANWEPKLKKLLPSLGLNLNDDAKLAKKATAATAKTLKITA